MYGFISPDDFKAKAEELMLDGREAVTREDWLLLVNCFAINTPTELTMPICQLMVIIYQAPVTEEDVTDVVTFQLGKRGVNLCDSVSAGMPMTKR